MSVTLLDRIKPCWNSCALGYLCTAGAGKLKGGLLQETTNNALKDRATLQCVLPS